MQERNAPEFNYQDFSDKDWDQRSKDLCNTDADYAKSYVRERSQSEATVMNEHRKFQLDETRKASKEQSGALAQSVMQVPEAEHLSAREDYYAWQRNQGLDRNEAADQLLEHGITLAKQSGDLSYITRLAQPDANGVSPLTDGRRALQAQAAIHAITQESKKEFDIEEATRNAEIQETVLNAAQSGQPMGENRDIVYGFLSAGVLKTPEQAKEFYHKLDDARAKAAQGQSLDAQLDNPNTARAIAGTDEGKKRIEQRLDAVWRNVDPTDPKAVDQATVLTVNSYAKWGFIPDQMKSVFKFSTMAAAPGQDVPVEFLRGAAAITRMETLGASEIAFSTM